MSTREKQKQWREQAQDNLKGRIHVSSKDMLSLLDTIDRLQRQVDYKRTPPCSAHGLEVIEGALSNGS